MGTKINNEFYDELGDRWWDDDQHAVAVLRVEGRLKTQFILDRLRRSFGDLGGINLLDIACGAGFLSIPLAAAGVKVKGVDASGPSIEVARKRVQPNSSLEFAVGDACALSESDASYDAVLLMDCLEHFENPGQAVSEASRVLKPGGLLFIHTFNRTWLANLLAVKAISILAPGTPKHVHVYDMFITPDELRDMCKKGRLEELEMTGIQPDFLRIGFWRTILKRKIQPGFEFVLCQSLAMGYMGTFRKLGNV
jgi:2-polyprenyl-6-hydroxyphenyl methylase/3-demethylubiquinone-9 3-methyltransferase